MSNLVKFDPKTLTEKLTEKIKDGFVDLIPEEKWKEMVETEVKAFFVEEAQELVLHEGKESSSWGAPTVRTLRLGKGITPFRAFVWNLCLEETQKYIKRDFIQEFMSKELEQKEGELTSRAEELIVANIEAGIARFFRQVAANQAQQMVAMLRQDIQNGQVLMYDR